MRRKCKRIVLLCCMCVVLVNMMGCATKEETKQNEQPTVQETIVQENEKESEQETKMQQVQETVTSVNSEAPVLTMDVNNITVKLGMDMNDLIDQLGEADDYSAAKSCTGEGEDKIYTYGGISLYTYPEHGKDIIFIIELAGEEVLASGLGIGSSRVDILAAYGEDYMDDGMYLEYEYEEGATTLCFTMDGDIATLVEIYGAQP